MKVSLIVAMGKNREIGKNNDLLWHLPADMQFFKNTTKDNIVVMGRKNWESIPIKYRPLPNRLNIVLTKNTAFKAEGAEVFYDLETVFNTYSNDKRTCFIIGGAQVYQLALASGKVNELFITHVNSSFDADTFFPNIDLSNWKSSIILSQEKNEKHPYGFIVKHYKT